MNNLLQQIDNENISIQDVFFESANNQEKDNFMRRENLGSTV